MKERQFNREERTIIRNLDLLAKGSRGFIESKLADSIEPRWHYCLNNFAAELDLRRIVDEYRNEAEVGIVDTTGPDDFQADECEKSALSWPSIDGSATWMGRRKSRAHAPKLTLSPPTNLPDLCLPNDFDIRLSYTSFSMAMKDRKRADALAKQYGLSPDEALWSKHDRLAEDRKITRFDTPWVFRPAVKVANGLAINIAALLAGRKPPSLKIVAPDIAELLRDYRDICKRFEQMQKKEGIRLGRPLAEIRKTAGGEWPRTERTPESEFLRSNATVLLKATAGFASYRWNDQSWDHVNGDADASLSERVWRFVDGAVVRTCSECLSQVDYTPYVEDSPLGAEQRRYWKWKQSTVWQWADNNLTLAVHVRTPDGIESGSVHLDIQVYVNSIITKNGIRSLDRFRTHWEQSRAPSCFERWEGVRWTPKQAKVPDRFWGYSTSLEVDLNELAAESDKAVDCLDPVLEAFVEASTRWEAYVNHE